MKNLFKVLILIWSLPLSFAAWAESRIEQYTFENGAMVEYRFSDDLPHLGTVRYFHPQKKNWTVIAEEARLTSYSNGRHFMRANGQFPDAASPLLFKDAEKMGVMLVDRDGAFARFTPNMLSSVTTGTLEINGKPYLLVNNYNANTNESSGLYLYSSGSSTPLETFFRIPDGIQNQDRDRIGHDGKSTLFIGNHEKHSYRMAELSERGMLQASVGARETTTIDFENGAKLEVITQKNNPNGTSIFHVDRTGRKRTLIREAVRVDDLGSLVKPRRYSIPSITFKESGDPRFRAGFRGEKTRTIIDQDGAFGMLRANSYPSHITKTIEISGRKVLLIQFPDNRNALPDSTRDFVGKSYVLFDGGDQIEIKDASFDLNKLKVLYADGKPSFYAGNREISFPAEALTEIMKLPQMTAHTLNSPTFSKILEKGLSKSADNADLASASRLIESGFVSDRLVPAMLRVAMKNSRGRKVAGTVRSEEAAHLILKYAMIDPTASLQALEKLADDSKDPNVRAFAAREAEPLRKLTFSSSEFLKCFKPRLEGGLGNP